MKNLMKLSHVIYLFILVPVVALLHSCAVYYTGDGTLARLLFSEAVEVAFMEVVSMGEAIDKGDFPCFSQFFEQIPHFTVQHFPSINKI